MKNMEIKALSGADICNIIKVCSKSQVKSLRVGDFEVQFGDMGTDPAHVVETIAPEAVEPPVNYELSIAQERAKEDLELAQEIIDDPQGFEQSVIDSYLQRAGHEDTQSG